MCEHVISRHLKLAFVEHMHEKAEADQISASYDQHASAVYGVLMRVVDCEMCAGEILVNTFVTTCCKDQPSPRLHQLMTAALACSCRSMEEKDRHHMHQRITDWYSTSRAHSPTLPQAASIAVGRSSSEYTLIDATQNGHYQPDCRDSERYENRSAQAIGSGTMDSGVKTVGTFESRR